jgi:hypothetical protein
LSWLFGCALGSAGGVVGLCSCELVLAGGAAGVWGVACCASATLAAANAVKANTADSRFM